MNTEQPNIEKLRRAGLIARDVRAFAKGFIRKNMKLLEIAQRIDTKIAELGGKPAFPVNLSMNEIAAHATPSFSEEGVAAGLLKVDIGVHIDGWIADTAVTLDLEESSENEKLISAAEAALAQALRVVGIGVTLGELGSVIEREIKKAYVLPIQNLSGHGIKQYDLHAGVTVPNYGNGSTSTFSSGVYAIEPFTTTGFGAVKDGKPSGIFALEREGNVRDPGAREVLRFIQEEYQSLPFCSRWIYMRFGARGLLALKRIMEAGLLHEYSQLVEKTGALVAQAEHTVLLTEDTTIITTL